MIKKEFSILLVTTVVAFGCEKNESAAGGAARSVTRSDIRGGGAVDFRPRAIITAPWRGASGVDSLPRVNVSLNCLNGGACATDPKATLALIASKIHVVAGGTTIGFSSDAAAMAGQNTKTIVLPATEYMGSLLPTAALAADSSYSIEIQSDGDVVLGFMDSSSAEQANALGASNSQPFSQTIPIFTGSAPVPTRVEFNVDPAKPLTSIRVRFSEPVQLSSLVQSAFGISDNAGSRVPGCVWSAGSQRCADGKSTEVAELFDYAFSGSVLPATMTAATLAVGGSIVGSGRTLGQGAVVTNRLLAPLAAGGTGITVPLSAHQWTACSPRGDVSCIRHLGL
jgi:hypothetical protein